MTVLQEEQKLYPRMLVFVTKPEDSKKLEEIFSSHHIPLWYQCRGKGTAPSEMLDIFGLSGTTRLITLGILPKFMVKAVFETLSDHLALHKKGGGIAFTIPLTGLQGSLLQVLNEDTREIAERRLKERMEKDMTETREKSEYSAVWVSVETGYSDEVVEAARAAGARGGTILKGLRQSSQRASQHFGIPMQDEQDFVMILVPRTKKAEVMNAICQACGLRTPAHGVILSLPVDEALGLED